MGKNKGMKQNITADQVRELNLTSSEIMKLFNFKKEDINFISLMLDEEARLEIIAESLTIGKMIEFLHENNGWIALYTEPDCKRFIAEIKTPYQLSRKASEPCDALWEAVKAVIKEK